jgi:23S rRNA (uracil1939-C5)-methyltransferase
VTREPATGATVELTIRAIGTGGEGVGSLPDGRACFVHRTAPGDRVAVRLLQDRPRWARGHLQEVLEPGPDRRTPPCELYDRCGGCTLQHLSYPAQLAAKESIVTETLRRVGGIQTTIAEVVPSPRETMYRNRVSFTLRRLRGGGVVAGFHSLHAPGRIQDVIGECVLPAPEIARAWSELREAWGPGARLLPPGGTLRLTLKSNGSGVSLLVEGGGSWPRAERLLAKSPGLTSIWWSEAGKSPRRLAPGDHAEEEDSSLGALDSPWAFTQVNPEMGAILQTRVLEEADIRPGHRLVDAYCGVGRHGAEAAKRGAEVVGIELDEQAVALARRTVPESVRIRQGTVEGLLPECLPAQRVILNPPRGGLHQDVPEALLENPVDRIVYVSCDPATLGRDLKRLASGYRVIRVQVLDMFPQTAHMETVVTLEATRGSDQV